MSFTQKPRQKNTWHKIRKILGLIKNHVHRNYKPDLQEIQIFRPRVTRKIPRNPLGTGNKL